MNPFEKIFNYQLFSRLENRRAFMISSHERSWLKSMLNHPSAADAFVPETLEKLRLMLKDEADLEWGDFLVHKAASREKMVYHPLIRKLRRNIRDGHGLTLAFSLKNGDTRVQREVFPYKLEYSMVKREWYLLWLNRRKRIVMSTRLGKIIDAAEHPLPAETAAAYRAESQAYLHAAKTSADIAVVPTYNGELSRILHAFSCFERDICYNQDQNEYRITLHFSRNETEFVLSKLRFLGKRVRVVSGERLQHRMRQTAAWALARYGVSDAAKPS